MKILLLGVGMQGKATLFDLVSSTAVGPIIAADADLEMLASHVKQRGWEAEVQCEPLDAAKPESIARLMSMKPDVVIDLLPPKFCAEVAKAAIDHRVHLVNTLYARDELMALNKKAKAQGVTLLPEFGLDPGIDLVMLGEGARSLDSIEEMHSYGAGLPERSAADNPLHYKVSWSFEGVLGAYRRPARAILDGKVREIVGADLFAPDNVHEVVVPGVGELEAYFNGDALQYVGVLGLDPQAVRASGRYTMRWPGHTALWKNLVDLHLLDPDPVMVDGAKVDRLRFLARAIGPHIQYEPGERDLVVVRVDLIGRKAGQRKRVRYELVDWLDLYTGLSAMSRTVGFTASIGAIMIGNGRIRQRGVLSPVTDVPYKILVDELAKREIRITCEETAV
ncbi:MAG: saccharopine dehydrogenase NADP-binding domain-containing protein [Planctomycetes bacterium]|nr:saccharopine dehydrogenase NADP-binding domain-containing protein [Planctomycetota bacterium]